MRLISRHLPPLRADTGKMPLLGKVSLAMIFLGFTYWIYTNPVSAITFLGAIALFVVVLMVPERRREDRLRSERKDTICDFARSFDLRQVDSWIVRATHEEFVRYFDPKKPPFPLQASDLIEEDLCIDWEELESIADEVAQRAGYDLSDCESNPLFGKIETVADFVVFFTHQRKIRKV